jgi:hypothetical protein
MSSPEFAELRGISGVAVSARAAVVIHARKKEFLWWLQAQSLPHYAEIEILPAGGLRRVARELVEMFPDRIAEGNKEDALRRSDSALRPEHRSFYNNHTQSVEEFLVDLCINPRIHFPLPGDDVDVSDMEAENAMEENPELSQGDFKTARLNYFNDITGALFEYKARQEANIRGRFQLTAIGRQVWETLDYALASRGMVVLDGLEGRGKSEAAKAWCGAHMGTARFVSLKGIATKTTAFREIAKALGIGNCYTRTATELQARIEDVLKRSKLMLVIDEAHFIFNQSRRMYTRPELVDWIDTAICNCGVPIALVTTPQFIVCMTRAADQVEWNYRQFRRRVKRWVKLPARNTEADIRAVIKSVFKNAHAQMVSLIAGYALLSKRDLSAVGDIAAEVRVMLGDEDLSAATLEQVHSAIHEHQLLSDKTFLEDMAAARASIKKPGRKTSVMPTMPVPASAPEPLHEEQQADVAEETVQPAPPAERNTTPVLSTPPHSRRGTAADLAAA